MTTEPKLQPTDLQEGKELPPLTKDITQEDINLYAEASLDFNPIHIDPDFARNTPLGGTIAHGMLVLGYLSHMMTLDFGKDWLNSGYLNLRFKTPARPGDTLTLGGRVRKLERTGRQMAVKCDVFCRNQQGETIISGDATVKREEP